MSDRDLEARLDAVERALTDGETDLAGLEEAADLAAGIDRLEERIEALESSVEELDAAVQAVRGYAGNVRAVNRDVERRASAALAKAETLETAIDGTPTAGNERNGRSGGRPGEVTGGRTPGVSRGHPPEAGRNGPARNRGSEDPVDRSGERTENENGDGDGQSRRTSQFIERVRDVL